MKSSILYRKVIMLTLAVVLLTFSIQDISYGQIPVEDIYESEVLDIPVEVEIVRNLSVNQIYDKAIRSVVWIVAPNSSQASGVLLDKELRLVVTNEHVADTHEWVVVFFPARDKDGKLIEERDFYANENNIGVLERLGYATMGRVVDKELEADLAIIELEGIPETAREIDHDFSYPAHYHVNRNDRVHVLGNPGDLKLWRWTGGFFQGIFQEDGKEILLMDADTYQGNSGGPVLNERGMLIGIISRSNLRTSTVAVPVKYVDDLLKRLAPKQIFSIQNNTTFTIPYQVKWTESDNWEETSIKPGHAMNHWYTESLRTISEGYPKIRFDYVANDGVSTYRYYKLETYQRRAGSNFKPSREQDAREYQFDYNYVTEILDLHDSERK